MSEDLVLNLPPPASKSPAIQKVFSRKRKSRNLKALSRIFVCVCAALLFGALLAKTRADQNPAPESEYVKAFKRFIESPAIIKSLKARFEFPISSVAFVTNDITD